jgi:hypothetical protein
MYVCMYVGMTRQKFFLANQAIWLSVNECFDQLFVEYHEMLFAKTPVNIFALQFKAVLELWFPDNADDLWSVVKALQEKTDPPIASLRKTLASSEVCRVLFADQAKKSAFLCYRECAVEKILHLRTSGYTVDACGALWEEMATEVKNLRDTGYTDLELARQVTVVHFAKKKR